MSVTSIDRVDREEVQVLKEKQDTGEALKLWRRKRALSMRQLAAAAQVNYMTVWRIENGKTEVHVSTLRKLAAALDIDPSRLV